MELEKEIKRKAADLGISFCNITSVALDFDATVIEAWYAKDYAADMNWLKANLDKRLQPSLMLPGAQSIIVCGLNYFQEAPERRGKIATYALGRDYHKVLGKKLKDLSQFIEEHGGETKCYVDTAPIFERPIAEKAGAGWVGKSSLLVNKIYGKYFFLGEIFTTLNLQVDLPHENLCGSCKKCIDACPTGAIEEPGVVNANKCISYQTIENKGEIPVYLREKIGDRLYGCDDCTAACPWNKKKQRTLVDDFKPRAYPDLKEMLLWNEKDFTRVFAGSPIHRIKLQRLKRNIAVVLGNIGNKNDLEALNIALKLENHIITNNHIKYAIKQIDEKK